MDPQTPPTASSPATFAHHHHHHHHTQRRPESTAHEDGHIYREKDAYSQRIDVNSHRGSKGSNGGSHDSVISHPFSPKTSVPPSPSSSVSSAGRKHRSLGDIQPASSVSISYPPRAYIDPEKANRSSHGSRSPRSHTRVSASNPDVTAVVYDSGEYQEKGPEEKPLQLLLFLSGPCAFLSFGISVWSVICIFLAVLLQPLRIFTSRPSLSTQITKFLAPPLNLQLNLIYSHAESTDYSPSMLVVVHLFSPIIAIGVALSAWTAAFFWFFSAILGDPAGQDAHNDGKESILGVRNWWERWLSRALR